MSKFKWTRGGIVLAMSGILAALLLIYGLRQVSQPREVNLSTMIADIKTDVATHKVDTLTVDSGTLTLDRQGAATERAATGDGFSLGDTLKRDNGIDYGNPKVLNVGYSDSGFSSNMSGILMTLLPVLLIVGVLFFVMRSLQGGGGQAMSFSKSRAKMFVGNKQSVTFKDVAGVEEAKLELQEIVEFLKFPQKFASLGARIPKGVLLVGSPGTGKTLVSRAVAGEAGVPFFSISGSEFVEMFVGVGASRVRDLFEQAKKIAPCIVFVDEIDAVGRQRGMSVGGSNDEREQTLNQLLVEMDGFDPNTNIIVMAATNRPDVLDPALLRPGRFDRQVILDKPDLHGRQEILEVHAQGKPIDSSVSMQSLAKQTAGFSGADLQNFLNEAAILAARAGHTTITREEFDEALDRVTAGPARKSRVITEREKAITAYHEVGHALVARVLPGCDPVHKVSIVSRGSMGGYTRLVPEDERTLWTKGDFENFLAFALGGRVAEEIIFGEITTGASNDIERVTAMARKMVTEYGMSPLGTIRYAPKEDGSYVSRDTGTIERGWSEKTAREIDETMRDIVHRAYETATRVLRENKDRLILISERLIQQESLEGTEFENLFTMEPNPDETLAALHALSALSRVRHDDLVSA